MSNPPVLMSMLRAFAAVASAMIGVRRGANAKRDWSQVRPLHLVIAALSMVGCFVALLITIANLLVP